MFQNVSMPRGVIHDHIAALPGVIPQKTWGEMSYFYNPEHALPRGIHFGAIKDHNGRNDRALITDPASRVWLDVPGRDREAKDQNLV
ncbi:DUF6194 family protein [Roseinatronobacter sp.]